MNKSCDNDKGSGAAHTVVESLWQGQSNERVRSLQAAFADALGKLLCAVVPATARPDAPGAGEKDAT